MASESFDFAVFGSTPLARLVAGLLASSHGKRVCLVGEANSAFRLARGLDLSVGLITRPETWALLGKTVPELQKLLAKVAGKGVMERIDPVFGAESPSTVTALAHMRHVAIGFGHDVDRLPENSVGRGTTAMKVNDAFLLLRSPLEAGLDTWLDKIKVLRVRARDSQVSLKRDGSVEIRAGTDRFDAARSVLADDTAILAQLDPLVLEPILRIESAVSLMTEPTAQISAPVISFIDRGVVLAQRSSRGIAAIGLGRVDEALARIGASLAGQQHVRRAGQTVFRTLSSVDGVPVAGAIRGTGATVLAGLGPTGAFQAPALARILAGAATEAETRYFAAREVISPRAMVADYFRATAEAAP